MLIDYKAVRHSAEKIIQECGRKVLFRKLIESNEIENQPWAGVGSLELTAYQEVEMYAVMINASNSNQFLGMGVNIKDLLAKCNKMFIVAAKEADEADLSYFTHIVDEGKTARIMFLEKLKPGSVALLYYVGVAEK
jgi:hypothetical protein